MPFFFPRNAKARNLQQPVTTGPKSIELVGRCCFSQDNVRTASNPAGRSNLSNVSTICSGEDRNLKCHRRCQETSLGFRGELWKKSVSLADSWMRAIKNPNQTSLSWKDLGQESSCSLPFSRHDQGPKQTRMLWSGLQGHAPHDVVTEW